MSKIVKTTLIVCISFLIPRSGNSYVQLEIYDREDNSLGIQGEWSEDQAYLGTFDCLDDIEMTFEFTVQDEDTSGKELYLFTGDSCDEDSECNNTAIEYDADEDYATVSTSWILDDADCNATIDTQIWLALLDSKSDKDEDAVWATTVDIDFSVEEPAAPEEVSASVGEGKLHIEWTMDTDDDEDDEDEDLIGFLILYSAAETSSDDSNSDGCDGVLVAGNEVTSDLDWKYVDGGDKRSGNVGGLQDGKKYQIAVSTVDDHGNPSRISEVVCEIPEETIDFSEAYHSAGGDGGGEFCFVATAAFGDYDHPVVLVLRDFRDHFLVELPGGTSLIEAYYTVGPLLATIIGSNAQVKAYLRGALRLVAGLAVLLMMIGPNAVIALFMAAVLAGILFGSAISSVPRGDGRRDPA